MNTRKLVYLVSIVLLAFTFAQGASAKTVDIKLTNSSGDPAANKFVNISQAGPETYYREIPKYVVTAERNGQISWHDVSGGSVDSTTNYITDVGNFYDYNEIFSLDWGGDNRGEVVMGPYAYFEVWDIETESELDHYDPGYGGPVAVSRTDLVGPDANGNSDKSDWFGSERNNYMYRFTDGSDNAWSAYSYNDCGGTFYALTSGDYDGDGRAEAIQGEDNGNLAAFDHDGSSYDCWIDDPGGNIEGLTSADFNDDGYDDFIAVESNGQLNYYESQGSYRSFNYNYFDDPGGGGPATAADFDGDGNMDFAMLEKDYMQVNVYLGDGNGNFNQHYMGDFGSNGDSIKSADIDGDGDMDLVSGEYDGQLRWHENDGSGTNWNTHYITDVGDDVMSIAITHQNASFEKQTVKGYCSGQTDSNGVFSCEVSESGSYNVSIENGKVRFEDVSFPNSITYKQYNSGSFGDYTTLNVSTTNDVNRTVPVEKTRSKIDKIVTAEDNGQISWHNVSGESVDSTTNYITDLGNFYNENEIFSLDWGEPDVNSGENFGKVVMGSNSYFEVWDIDTETELDHYDPGSGGAVSVPKTDLVEANANGNSDKSDWFGSERANYMYRFTDGSDNSWSPSSYNDCGGYFDSVTSGDYDGDGRAEAIQGEDNGNLAAFDHDGSTYDCYFDDPGGAIVGLTSADFNEDGYDDFIAIEDNGNINFYESQGSYNSFNRNYFDDPGYGGPATAADFDGDGHMDFAMLEDNYMQINVYMGDGNGNFNQHYMGDFGGSGYSLKAADVDDDGDMDLVSGENDGQLRWHENTGSGTSWNTHYVTDVGDGIRSLAITHRPETYTVNEVVEADVFGSNYSISKSGSTEELFVMDSNDDNGAISIPFDSSHSYDFGFTVNTTHDDTISIQDEPIQDYSFLDLHLRNFNKSEPGTGHQKVLDFDLDTGASTLPIDFSFKFPEVPNSRYVMHQDGSRFGEYSPPNIEWDYSSWSSAHNFELFNNHYPVITESPTLTDNRTEPSFFVEAKAEDVDNGLDEIDSCKIYHNDNESSYTTTGDLYVDYDEVTTGKTVADKIVTAESGGRIEKYNISGGSVSSSGNYVTDLGSFNDYNEIFSLDWGGNHFGKVVMGPYAYFEVWNVETENELYHYDPGNGGVVSVPKTDLVTANIDGDSDKTDWFGSEMNNYMYRFTDGSDDYWSRYGYTDTGGYFDSLTSGDYDGDGRAEAIQGEDNGNLAAFDDGGSYDSYITDIGGSVRGLTSADFNEDGYDDFISVEDDGQIRYHESQGSYNSFNQDYFDDPGYGGPATAADFDGDGHMDFAMLEDNYMQINVYMGDGNGNFNRHYIGDFGSDGYALKAADVDDDGDMDLVSGEDDGQLRWHENTGSGTSWNEHYVTDVGSGIRSLAITHRTKKIVTGVENRTYTCNATIDDSFTDYNPGDKLDLDVEFIDKYSVSNSSSRVNRIPNLFMEIKDRVGNVETGEQVTVYESGTSQIASIGDRLCQKDTDSRGLVSCGLASDTDYDIATTAWTDKTKRTDYRVSTPKQVNSLTLKQNLTIQLVGEDGNTVSNEQVSIYRSGTSTIECEGDTNSTGGIACALEPANNYDLQTSQGTEAKNVDIPNLFTVSRGVPNRYLNLTVVDSGGSTVADQRVSVFESGTGTLLCEGDTNEVGNLKCGLDSDLNYDVETDEGVEAFNVDNPNVFTVSRGVPNKFLNISLLDSSGADVTDQTLSVYRQGTNTLLCQGDTNEQGHLRCGLNSDFNYDAETDQGEEILGQRVPDTLTAQYGSPNNLLYVRLVNSTGDIVRNRTVSVYKNGTSILQCRGNTTSEGKIHCGLDTDLNYDMKTSQGREAVNVDHPNNFTISSGLPNKLMNLTIIDSSGDPVYDERVSIYESNTDKLLCRGDTNKRGNIKCGLNSSFLYRAETQHGPYLGKAELPGKFELLRYTSSKPLSWLKVSIQNTEGEPAIDRMVVMNRSGSDIMIGKGRTNSEGELRFKTDNFKTYDISAIDKLLENMVTPQGAVITPAFDKSASSESALVSYSGVVTDLRESNVNTGSFRISIEKGGINLWGPYTFNDQIVDGEFTVQLGSEHPLFLFPGVVYDIKIEFCDSESWDEESCQGSNYDSFKSSFKY